MTDTQNIEPTSGRGTMPYDTLLQALEEGVILTINQSDSYSTPSGELQVESSKNTNTDVLLTDALENYYTIYRDYEGTLVYAQVTEDGVSYEDDVMTFEIVGCCSSTTEPTELTTQYRAECDVCTRVNQCSEDYGDWQSLIYDDQEQAETARDNHNSDQHEGEELAVVNSI